MKKSLSLVMLIILVTFSLMVCSKKSPSSELTIKPEKARPGETITFSYVPGDKLLTSRDKFNLYVYSYSTELPEVKSIELTRAGKKWTGSLPVNDKAYGLVAKIKLDRENEDNNQGKGYIFALYTQEGKLVPGHKAGLALAYTSWGQLAGINQDLKEALRLTEEDFQANPEIKKNFVNSYLRLLQAVKPEGWDQKTSVFLDEVSSLPDLDDSTLTTLYRFYGQTGNQEKARAIFEQARKNPGGEFFQIQALMQLQSMQDSRERVDFFKKFQSDFPDSKYIESMAGMITQGLFQEKKLEEAVSFLLENRERVQPYYFYAIGSQAGQTEGWIDLALRAVDHGITLLNDQLKNPEKFKPAYYTTEEWQDEMETTLMGMFLSLKGNLLLKKGNPQEAASALKQAYEASKDQADQSTIALDYARVLLENKNYEQALQVLETTGKKGFAIPDLFGLLKQAYAGVHQSEEGWDNYQKQLELAATEYLKVKLKKKMIDTQAPAFELKDLKGKVVKLSDYQGKVVVLDFWATWCGPCLNSFPGMKKMVEQFEKDQKVAFVFINTWQDETNKDEVVREFLEKNQYPFYVLMDSEDKVVAQFGVSGIPTKFVIDPRGKIRFKSIGYEGNEDKMIKEVKLMIELAKGK
jgi:peroxiredoxin/predicted negative regulator of RcsB-dependent stress response